jgi:Holliday junction resolvase-like predicted endonuclease
LCVGARAGGFVILLLSARHSAKVHQPRETKNSCARKRRVAEACSEKPMVIWYLRRQGYVFIAKNYMPQGIKGELDLVGYDGETIAFVEIRTRTVREDISGLPELSVSYAKQSVLVRTAQRFLADRHLHDCPTRFDVLAIDNIPGRPPEIRLHKDAFSPQLRRSR